MSGARIQYKGCTIIRTASTATVSRCAGLHSWQEIVPLYAIEGAVAKAAISHPLLTSLAEARRYISEAIDAST